MELVLELAVMNIYIIDVFMLQFEESSAQLLFVVVHKKSSHPILAEVGGAVSFCRSFSLVFFFVQK